MQRRQQIELLLDDLGINFATTTALLQQYITTAVLLTTASHELLERMGITIAQALLSRFKEGGISSHGGGAAAAADAAAATLSARSKV